MTSEQNKMLTYKALFAGIMIGLGGCVYSRVENHYIGAFLFSFGLLTILNLEGLLYTGKIGYFEFKEDIGDQICRYVAILSWNFIAVLIVGLVTFDFDNQIFITKLNHSLLQTFISSIFCGIMMYLAVELWKKNKSPLYVIMAIMIFILAGFDHCVANMYYFAINPIPAFNIRTIIFFILNIAGNTIGSIAMRKITK